MLTTSRGSGPEICLAYSLTHKTQIYVGTSPKLLVCKHRLLQHPPANAHTPRHRHHHHPHCHSYARIKSVLLLRKEEWRWRLWFLCRASRIWFLQLLLGVSCGLAIERTRQLALRPLPQAHGPRTSRSLESNTVLPSAKLPEVTQHLRGLSKAHMISNESHSKQQNLQRAGVLMCRPGDKWR